MARKAILGLVVVTGIVSCASLTPEGAKVRSTRNPVATTGCKFLGRLEAENDWGPSDTETKLMNQAAKLGADTLLYPAGGRFVHLYGEAYLCGTPKFGVPVRPAEEPTPLPASPQPSPTPHGE